MSIRPEEISAILESRLALPIRGRGQQCEQLYMLGTVLPAYMVCREQWQGTFEFTGGTVGMVLNWKKITLVPFCSVIILTSRKAMW